MGNASKNGVDRVQRIGGREILGLFALMFLAGCAAGESSPVVCGEGTREIQGVCVADNAAGDEGSSTTQDAPTSTTPTTTSPPPPDPGDELRELVRGAGVSFNSGLVSHSCGTFAFVATPQEQRLIAWDKTTWVTELVVPQRFQLEGATVSEFATSDLNGDGKSEIVIRWAPEFAMREVGAVLKSNPSDCSWSWQELVDSCNIRFLYDNLTLSPEGDLIGSGWSGGCSPREGVRFQWFSEVQRFVARPFASDSQMCGVYDEFNIDLPLMTCTRTWAVQMFQEGLRAAGFNVNPDGYFGPGTQVAVIGYQQRLGLDASGLIDELTWASMFPVNWDDGFPDYDGDGISSPREIAHWSGG